MASKTLLFLSRDFITSFPGFGPTFVDFIPACLLAHLPAYLLSTQEAVRRLSHTTCTESGALHPTHSLL